MYIFISKYKKKIFSTFFFQGSQLALLRVIIGCDLTKRRPIQKSTRY